MSRAQLVVACTWDGVPVGPDEHATLELQLEGEELRVRVEAPFHGDPAPHGPPGPCDGLWEYEAVELFLLGADERYLELELGPFGHHLLLELHGARRRVAGPLALDYAAERRGARWSGRARLPRARLPRDLHAANAYALHGIGAERRYLAAQPVGGAAPDFHRLERFAPLRWEPRA